MTRATSTAVGIMWLVAVSAAAAGVAVAPALMLGDYVFFVVMLVFVTMGTLIVRRAPGNAVGWLLIAEGLFFSIGVSLQAVAHEGGDGGWIDLAGWLGDLTWAPMIALLFPLLAVFPTGRVAEGWWRIDLWAASGFVVLAALTNGFGPTADAGLPNPYANPAIDRFAEPAGTLSLICLLVGLAFGVVSLFVRYRRGGPTERQQIKWFLLAAVFLPVALVISELNQQSGVGPAILGLAMIAFPIAIGVAVLKFRLYDIDRLINRTAVYAIVVGLLGVVFAAGAVWIPSLLQFADNNLAVAASTLAVFFLFNPLRQRTQRFVDRRFYRSRYDAQQIADEFATRLRDQVDPEVVAGEWVEVVQRTLQPTSVAVWVRDPSVS